MADEVTTWELVGRDRTKQAFRSVNSSMSRTEKQAVDLKGALIAIGTALSVREVVQWGGAVLDVANDLTVAAEAVGLTTTALQEYQEVARQAGLDSERLGDAFTDASTKIGELRAGEGELRSTLQEMNPALLTQLQTVETMDQAYDALFRALAETEDQFERNALASAFFSDSGVELVNIVRDGADAFDAARREAHDLGRVLDADAVQALDRAHDAIDDLVRDIEVSAMWALAELADEIEWVANLFSTRLPEAMRETHQLVALLQSAFTNLKLGIDAAFSDLGVDLDDFLSGAAETIGDWLDWANRIPEELFAGTAIGDQLAKMREMYQTVLAAIIGDSEAAGEAIAEALSEPLEVDIFPRAQAAQQATAMTDDIEAILEGGFSGVMENWRDSFEFTMDEIADEQADATASMDRAWERTADVGLEALADLATGAELSFDSMLRAGLSVAQDLIKAFWEVNAASQFGGGGGGGGGGLLGGLFGSIGSLFGGGGGAGAVLGTSGFGATLGGNPHFATGGTMPHDGTAELHRGEFILTPDQFEMVAGGGGEVNIEIINTTGQPARAEQRQNAQGGQDIRVLIGDAVASEVRRPGSRVNEAMTGQFGLRNQVVV